MIQSMTGYACSEGHCGGRMYKAEIRSVNHRYCEINVRLPESLSRMEQTIKNHISRQFSRGKFDVSINRIETAFDKALPMINKDELTSYQAMLNGFSMHFNVKFSLRKEVGIADLAALRTMASWSSTPVDSPDIEPAVMKIISKSLDSLREMRLREGQIIYKDLTKRINRLQGMINRVEKRMPVVISDMKDRYQERIRVLAGDAKVDMNRLGQEVAIMIERMDIVEEIVRVRSHITQLNDRLEKGNVVGRSLDFLLQEINREVNTIASKASDVKIAQTVVDMKAEIERVREQVQNIE